MSVHLELGKKGEQLAVTYLLKNEFTILYRNWRHSHYEIDIIAEKNNLLHFIEVKMRSTGKFGQPEENVTRNKIRFLLKAANGFLYKHPQYRNFQIDILSITN